METTTRLNSRVIIDAEDDKYLYGRWNDNEDVWYPCRWTVGGFLWDSTRISSLDIKV